MGGTVGEGAARSRQMARSLRSAATGPGYRLPPRPPTAALTRALTGIPPVRRGMVLTGWHEGHAEPSQRDAPLSTSRREKRKTLPRGQRSGDLAADRAVT